MYKMTSTNGDIAYGVKEFTCDSAKDLENLPSCEMGSVAIIIDTSDVYMKNSENKWVKL